MNKILQDTYDVLEQRGWCQGALRKADGRVCLEGAFATATCDNKDALLVLKTEEQRVAWERLCQAVSDYRGMPFPLGASPWVFNDDPKTTVEDVKLVLKKAIHDA